MINNKQIPNSLRKYNMLIDKLILILFSLLCFSLFALNTYNPDFLTFQKIFNFIRYFNLSYYSGIEFGFFWLMRISGLLGLNYHMFLFVIAVLFLTLFIKAIKKLSIYPGTTMAFYFFFPFLLDVIQIRNSVGYVITLHALIAFLEKKCYKTLFLIILASTFHTTQLFYLLIFLTLINKKILVRLILLLTSIFFILRPILIQILFLLPGGEKYSVYLNEFSYRRLLLYIIFVGVLIYFTNIVLVEFKKKTERVEKNIIKENLVLFLEKFSWIYILLLPLLAMSPDFFRLIRNFIILFIIGYLNVRSKNIEAVKNEFKCFEIKISLKKIETFTETIKKKLLIKEKKMGKLKSKYTEMRNKVHLHNIARKFKNQLAFSLNNFLKTRFNKLLNYRLVQNFSARYLSFEKSLINCSKRVGGKFMYLQIKNRTVKQILQRNYDLFFWLFFILTGLYFSYLTQFDAVVRSIWFRNFLFDR